jgi:hypothetical protein
VLTKGRQNGRKRKSTPEEATRGDANDGWYILRKMHTIK